MESISPIEAIKNGWSLTKSNFIVSLGLILAYGVLRTLLGLLPADGIVGGVCQLLSFVVSIVWSLGITKLSIEVVDGEEPRFGVFSEVMPRLIHFALMTILMSIILLVPFFVIFSIGVVTSGVSFTLDYSSNPMAIFELLSDCGLWLLVALIPVIYMSLRFIFAPYIFVDKEAGVMESLRMSWSATAPIQGKIFIFMLLSLVVALVGFLCLIVGLFVSSIVMIYAQATLYRQVFSRGIQDPLLVDNANVVVG